MHIIDLLKGVGIGIIFSIPLGPVGIIVMKRTAEFGLKAGILSGLAIVVIDTIGAVLILLGLHHSIPYLRHAPHWLHFVGSIIIFCYGFRMIITSGLRPIEEDLPWHRHFFSAAAIALTNPSTYFSFGIIGLLLSPLVDKPLFTRLEVAIGFCIGSLIWWCGLAFFSFTNRNKYLSSASLQRTVGVIIMILALTSFIPLPHIHRIFSFLPRLIQ
jgi:threonine/homoserine/homoserine lactone efflux protein